MHWASASPAILALALVVSLWGDGCDAQPGGAGSDVPALALEPLVAGGLREPVYLTHAGDGSNRLFIVEQAGRIRVLTAGRVLEQPILDISQRVQSGGERGLLGLAFHPKFRETGRLFVNYTRQPDGATVVAEYRVSPAADRARLDETVLLVVPQPYANHNGGMVAFGPDGYLYVAMGDGGAGGDPGNRGQNPQELLGKILRLDVDRGSPYAIPPDNPFATGGGPVRRSLDEGGRPEIYAFGFRNPWRFSFDRHDGSFWVSDVGQDAWEEINRVRLGGNYGWRVMEGRHCFLPKTGCTTDGLELPVAEYAHERGRCSIIGGYVYRGRGNPSLAGRYLFGDYCSGEIFWLLNGQPQVLLSTGLSISSFGEDDAGELYVIGHEGTVHRIVPAKAS